MEKTIEELEKELEEMQNMHKSMWEAYGTDFFAGDIIAKKEKLKLQIIKLKTIEKWKKLGLLNGLNGNVKEEQTLLFQSELSHKIKE